MSVVLLSSLCSVVSVVDPNSVPSVSSGVPSLSGSFEFSFDCPGVACSMEKRIISDGHEFLGWKTYAFWIGAWLGGYGGSFVGEASLVTWGVFREHL